MTKANTNAATTFAAEVAQANSVFNTGSLKAFLYEHAHDEVGTDRNTGLATTLIEEVGEVARMAHRAYISDGTNYYRSRSAFASVEMDDETKAERSDRMYIRAGKKLLFLNSVAKRLTGEYFLAKRFDTSSVKDMQELVDAFEFCVRNYDEI